MSEPRHTPGQWRIFLESDGRYSIESDVGTVAEVMAENCDNPDQVHADACLIAVAPELWALLAELHEETNPFVTDADSCECGEWGDGWSEGDGKGTPCIHIRTARLLCKATGETTR